MIKVESNKSFILVFLRRGKLVKKNPFCDAAIAESNVM